MALLHVTYFSEALNVQTSVDVILPEIKQGIGVDAAQEEALPKVLYLLHGYSDDHTIWQRRTSVERYASSRNLAIIMPGVSHSFYCNEEYGEKYWDFVSDELPKMMHRFFRLSDKPEDTFVAGLSMGGYGAMKLALNFPERFGAAASFSGAVDIASTSRTRLANWKRITGGKSIKGTDCDLFHLAKTKAEEPHKPRLYVSCGTADFLYGQHQKFIPMLKKQGWDVTHYEEPDATHAWSFWDQEIRKFINFIFED